MKNQGISLISLIITIIVIIILAAIVIFSGLNTPDSAQFAGFTQQVDNVYSAVMNKFGDLKAKHAISGDYRTNEQIYIEIATGVDPKQYATMNTTGVTTSGGTSTHIQHILPSATTDSEHSLGMTLPKVRESNNAWYVTDEGRVFNANGFVYDKKTYFSGSLYKGAEISASSGDCSAMALSIYAAIASGDNKVS